MNRRQITSGIAASVLAATCVAAGTGPAGAVAPPSGHRSILAMLAQDGHHLDRNWHDFDLADKFLHKVIAARPDSPLAVVAHGRQRVTAFLGTDAAYRRMATTIMGRHMHSERQIYRALMRVGGIDGAEGVLSANFVSGHTLKYHWFLSHAPTTLTTLQGATVKVRVHNGHVVLVDRDTASPNSRIIRPLRNLNAGNRQVAHGVTAVLSPDVSTG